jgi:error-prone DNA polymerase
LTQGEEKTKNGRMYPELYASSGFSFLRGASQPEELVDRAAEIGLTVLALVDRDGVAGAPRFFKAARARGIRPIVGAELTLAGGGCLPLLVESRRGYRNLCRLVTDMKAGEKKGEAALDLLSLAPEKVEVQRHRRRAQESAAQALLDLADARGLLAVATNGVRHARAPGRALLDVLTCIREKTTLAAAGRRLADNAGRTPRRWPTACASPSTTSATSSPGTRCRTARPCSACCARPPRPARSAAIAPTTSARAGRSSASWP